MREMAVVPRAGLLEARSRSYSRPARLGGFSAVSSCSQGREGEACSWRNRRVVRASAFDPFVAYAKAAEAAPMLTRSATCGVLFAVSDAVAQLGAAPRGFDGDGPRRGLDWARLGRYSLFGSLVNAPIFTAYYSLLDNLVDGFVGVAGVSTVLKVLVDQLLWTPFVYLPLFFGVMAQWEGRDALREAKERGWGITPVLVANWKFWFPVLTITFGLVPKDLRIPFNNVCAIVWTAYLSQVQSQSLKSSGA